MNQNNSPVLPVTEGNGAAFDLIQDRPWVVCLDLSPSRNVAVVLVVRAVILLLPALLKYVGTISPPRAMQERAVQEIRDMHQSVSFSLLTTGERFRANEALPAIHLGSNGWCDGTLPVDRGRWRGEVRLRLGVDKILSADP